MGKEVTLRCITRLEQSQHWDSQYGGLTTEEGWNPHLTGAEPILPPVQVPSKGMLTFMRAVRTYTSHKEYQTAEYSAVERHCARVGIGEPCPNRYMGSSQLRHKKRSRHHEGECNKRIETNRPLWGSNPRSSARDESYDSS